jgi:GTP-binding protein YchF
MTEKRPSQGKKDMHISIIGSPGCGKSTLFQALTGAVPGRKNGPDAMATIEVPDRRIEKLTEIFHPRKTTYAKVTVADTVAIEEGNVKKETIGSGTLQEMRGSDAFLLVLRNFDNGKPADLENDFRNIVDEFIFADMVQIEARLERIGKQPGKKDHPDLAREEASLKECLDHLNEGHPLATLPLFQTDGKQLKGFRFLSQKPLMVVVNCEETAAGGAAEGEALPRNGVLSPSPCLAACGKLEAELAVMDPGERESFMAEYGIGESVAGRIIGLAFRTLGLISFLTVGEDECRAWPIRNGMNAQEAAGTIHTSLSEKFIRAETVSYDDFIRHGGFSGCKKAGAWRLEGKTYIVHDGDILTIRAGN